MSVLSWFPNCAMHIVPCDPNSKLLPGAGWSNTFVDQLWSLVTSTTTKNKALFLKPRGISSGFLSTSPTTVSATWNLQSHDYGAVKFFRALLLKEQWCVRAKGLQRLFSTNLPRISSSFTNEKTFLRRRAEIASSFSSSYGTRDTNFR